MTGLLLICAVLAALLGAGVLVLGLRGRLINDHPICRGCRFDLVGLYPDADRCPECGRELALRRSIRRGERRRRWLVLALGVILLAAGGTGSGIGIWTRSVAFNWYPHLPDWFLLRDARRDAQVARTNLWKELTRRFESAELSPSEERLLAAACVSAAPPSGSTGASLHFHLLDSLISLGVCRTEHLALLIQRTPPAFEIRPRVRAGDPVPFRQKDLLLGSGSSLTSERSWERTESVLGWKVDGQDVGVKPLPSGADYEPREEAPFGPVGWQDVTALLDMPALTPGPHVVELHYRVGISCRTPPRDRPDLAPWDTVATLDAVETYPVDVVASGTDDDLVPVDGRALVHLRAALQASIVFGTSSRGEYADVGLIALRLPCPLFADLVLERPGGATLVGTTTIRESESRGLMNRTWSIPPGSSAALDGWRLRIVPRPDLTRMTVDIDALLGEEIVVPIPPPDGAKAPPLRGSEPNP